MSCQQFWVFESSHLNVDSWNHCPLPVMSEVPVIPKLDNTMGAIFVGVLMGAALWGISCMQTFEYFSNFPNDSLGSKVMIAALFILDTVHQIFMSHVLYTYLVTHFFNPAYLNVVVWSLVAQVIASAFIGFIVQSFFVYRIWILSQNNIPIVAFVMMLVFAEFGLTTAYFIKGLSVTTFTELPRLLRLSQSVNAVAAAGDILIAASLIFILYRSKTGFSRSDSIVNQLILYSLNTGFLTSVCALLSLITITVYPATFLFITFYTPLSRLYTNSVLATLNARKKLRLRSTTQNSHSMGSDTRDMQRNKSEPFAIASQDASHHLAIRVDKETALGYDAYANPTKSNTGYELSVFGSTRGHDRA
ncbi:hypothetical protein BDZ94DRAFT_1275050 [Collybia nuda]|uniref:DUF6534 domain-containing protein n=1 Tax=Collybia nuda TaxID=64659 RepID=A0A9P6CD38_9AGAR|nr:hypothetical protein BDZ94DRAFT_1275050 [Collybia nuda]